MLRLIFARLIAGIIGAILRPILRVGLLIVAATFVVELPARLWSIYVDPTVGSVTLQIIRWLTAVLLVTAWVRWHLVPRFRAVQQK